MEDEKIKQLFSNFQPRLSSSAEFMERLQKNMEIVEAFRQYNITLRRRNRVAVVIAAVCGFVFGIITMQLLNPLVSLLSEFTLSLPYLHLTSISINTNVFAWILIAGVSILSALHAYNLAMTKLTPDMDFFKHNTDS